jgi:hypothetical protein
VLSQQKPAVDGGDGSQAADHRHHIAAEIVRRGEHRNQKFRHPKASRCALLGASEQIGSMSAATSAPSAIDR